MIRKHDEGVRIRKCFAKVTGEDPSVSALSGVGIMDAQVCSTIAKQTNNVHRRALSEIVDVCRVCTPEDRNPWTFDARHGSLDKFDDD